MYFTLTLSITALSTHCLVSESSEVYSDLQVETKEFKLVYIPSNDNIANLFTKALPCDTRRNFTSDLGLWNGDKVKEKR